MAKDIYESPEELRAALLEQGRREEDRSARVLAELVEISEDIKVLRKYKVI